MLARKSADEVRREHQQGLGKPIIGATLNGHQFVAVGNELRWGDWKTFPDFLSDYIRSVLDPAWGNAEIKKPLGDRHPILQLYDSVCRYQAQTIKEPGKVHEAPMTGAVAAYLGLSYNLYLLAHNAELQRRLIARLKNSDQFYGAYYETMVAAWFILAGFTIELENEQNGEETHCEFTATSRSGKSYSVEAKSRGPNKESLDVGNQLYKALKKRAKHERIVLIDMRAPDDGTRAPEDWMADVLQGISGREEKMSIDGQPAPPAFVIVTNHPYLYNVENLGWRCLALAEGFKIPDFGANTAFRSLTEAFKGLKKYDDVFKLIKAIKAYRLPTTFDGEVPAFAFGNATRRWRVGERYDLSRFGEAGEWELTSGIVMAKSGQAQLAFHRKDDDRAILLPVPLSDEELSAYAEHPQTFFGVHQDVGREIQNPLDLYEWLYENHLKTPRQILLSQLESAPDYVTLEKLSDQDLLMEWCERLVAAQYAK